MSLLTWHTGACRSLVDESDAAVAHLVSKKRFKRPQLWEVPDIADRLSGIGSEDK